jgi:hypothetical protein
VLDVKPDRYFVEIFYPADASRPYVTTHAHYRSAAAAENDLIAILAAHANNPSAVDP